MFNLLQIYHFFLNMQGVEQLFLSILDKITIDELR